ncbi:MAG: Ig-like domain-containing protein, partial [Bacteroidales bacterium]|nr:Ig-like domain-containing protein [Bacteroidales bacterium]
DVTTNVNTCTSSTEVLSWAGKASSVTFTRPSDATGYATLSSVTVKLEAGEGDAGGGTDPVDPDQPEEPGETPVYASLADLVEAGAPTTDGTKVTVTLTNEEIKSIFVNGQGYRNGIFLEVGGRQIEIFSHDVPETWVAGGTVSGTLSECVWKDYKGTWELCPDDWSELRYEAPASVAVTSVSLNQTTASLGVGDTLTLEATVNPDNATNKAVTWSSNNSAVASVANGVVTAVAAGNATITVTTVDGGKTANCVVTVTAPVSGGDEGGSGDPIYTLDATNEVNQGSNNSYASNCDVTVDGITWNVSGNTQMSPWRIGGKSITSVDRTVYTKTAFESALSRVDLTVGAASSITVNSVKLEYSTNSDFSGAQSISKTFAANSTISFDAAFPANCYYRFTFNVTVSVTSNKFLEFKKVEFYGAE